MRGYQIISSNSLRRMPYPHDFLESASYVVESVRIAFHVFHPVGDAGKLVNKSQCILIGPEHIASAVVAHVQVCAAYRQST